MPVLVAVSLQVHSTDLGSLRHLLGPAEHAQMILPFNNAGSTVPHEL